MSIDAAVQALVQQTVSALMPQIVSAVQAQLGNVATPPAPAPAPTPTPAPTDAFGLSAAPAPATAVTAEMVQALIMPLVSNDTLKAQLSAEMHAMGIANLPDARPDQLPEVYARFQRVAAGATTNAAGNAVAQAAPASII